MRDVCPICESPHRAEVDTALTAGGGYKALARRFGLDVDALRAHRRGCLTASAPKSWPPPPALPLRDPYAGPVGAHAHAPARDPRAAGDFDSRVAFVIGEMAAGTFDPPKDGPELASAWGDRKSTRLNSSH